ncbi:FAD binding domain-containing protein [Sedimentitalea sp. JM2-8]|uniref:FAD binding domain-containing protein n=1 Tax=Sedimentitalea xiamensis TaxID=3050037 RepID=A0ABT7FF43_9RHOB|nr:FAD binding domain-containing protein [Sedimentitalea xiamensis]MDK3073751.1 FAD binding domain-containing protein [Sedimentitalea xiamensis]
MDEYFRPQTLTDALAVLDRTGATVAAGCTDLFAGTQKQTLPGPVLDLTAIAALRGIAATPEGWRIGATTTWSDVLGADLPPAFDMLKQAAREVGSVQIQNAGTVAGNLCNASPAADGVPPLLALGAQVELRSASGRRTLPLSHFLTGVRATRRGASELVTAIHVPRAAARGRSGFLKLGARRFLVISIAMVAVRVAETAGRVDDIALAVGSCSAVATRLPEVESACLGQPVASIGDHVRDDAVARALSPITDIRADAAYRATAATELLRRALRDVTAGALA